MSETKRIDITCLLWPDIYIASVIMTVQAIRTSIRGDDIGDDHGPQQEAWQRVQIEVLPAIAGFTHGLKNMTSLQSL